MFLINYPIVRKTDKTALYFECRNDQIVFINIEPVFDDLGSYMESINWSSEPDGTYELDGYFYVENYKVKVSIEIYSDHGYVYWRPYRFEFKPTDGWGESCDNIDNINNLHSDFNDTISNVDSYKQFVKFFVRQDSFQIFRFARDILWGKNNMDSNWMPLEQVEDVVINFTTDKDFRNDVQF